MEETQLLTCKALVLTSPGEVQLRDFDIPAVGPEDVTDIIFTHLHWDHCLPVFNAFEKAPLYVQRKELDVTVNPPHPWFTAHTFADVVRSLFLKSPNRVTIVDGDAGLLPGIKVMLTAGHAMGSQAVLAQSDDGPIVLTGDIALTPRNLKDDLHQDTTAISLRASRVWNGFAN